MYRGRTSYNVLARDMDLPNYRLIKALDDKYFALKAQKKVYAPIYDDPKSACPDGSGLSILEESAHSIEKS